MAAAAERLLLNAGRALRHVSAATAERAWPDIHVSDKLCLARSTGGYSPLSTGLPRSTWPCRRGVRRWRSCWLTGPTISHHLKVLREAGLITGERRGTWVYYRIEPDALRRVSAVLALDPTPT